MNTANTRLNDFKARGWIRSANLSDRCYVESSKTNDQVNDLIYKGGAKKIYNGKDGEYMFLFNDSAICFDGKLFEEMDLDRANQVLGCDWHGWNQI